MDIRYEEDFVVRALEVDVNKKLTIPALLKIMQEASMTSALQLNVSVWDMEKNNSAWVLLRKELNVIQMASLRDQIRVKTYPSSFDRFLAYRDYKMYNSEGELIAYASSTWTLINTSTRRMARIPIELSKTKVPEEESILEVPNSKIDAISRVDTSDEIKVAYYDLDWNGHVNNINYTKYMLEVLPYDFLAKKSLRKLVFHIKSESFLNDILIAQIEYRSDNNIIHRLVDQKTDKLVAQAESRWI